MAKLLVLLLVLLQASFLRGALRFSVDEEAPPGTVLGNLAEELQGPAEAAPRGFQLVKAPGNGSLVRVRERDGQLSVGPERLDREQLCGPSEAPCVLALDVLSLGGGGSAPPFRLVHVELEVRDLNDHAPRFPQPAVALEVSESAAPGTRLPLPLAHDPDAGSNGLQSFALSPGSPFGLEAQRRADGLRCAELVLLRELDREAQAGYRLELVATDGGSPARSGTATLSVRVLDANDNAPAFPRGALLSLELPEDAPPGALLLELEAADADEGANGQLLYAWGSQVPAEARRLFSLDPLSGRLALRAPVDYELQRAYELDVRVSDRGASPLAAACKVLVRLLDVNDNAPALAVSALAAPAEPGEAGWAAAVSEAAPAQSLVALVSTSDSDAGANGQVRCALLPAPHQPFALQRADAADSYLLLTTGALDRERLPEYNLTLVAEDLGSPPARTVRSLTVRVADENDNAPRFAKARYEVALPENNPPGAYLATVLASDPDLGPNGKVTYSLLDNQIMGASISTYVSVDAGTGAIYALRSFNYEFLKEMELSIQATDGGSPSLSSTALVKVRVMDQNDNAPVISSPALTNGSLEILLPLSAPPGFLISQLAARDSDDGRNSELTFSLLEGASRLFAVRPRTGELFLRERVPPEAAPRSAFRLVVAVEDGGLPSLTCTATLRLICTETLPSSVQIVALQLGVAGGEPWDPSVLWIALLGGGCGVLLVAILLVGASIWVGRKKFPVGKPMKPVGPREGGSRPVAPWGDGTSKDSAWSGAFSADEEESRDSLGVTETETPSSDSQARILIPVEPASEWEASQSASNFSYSGLDRVSGEDSGKGDSECSDSDFNTSRDRMKEISVEKVGKQNGTTTSAERTTCKESNIYNGQHAHLSLGRKHLPFYRERTELLSYPAARINRSLIQQRNTHCRPEFLPQSQDCLPVWNERLPTVCEQGRHSGTTAMVNSQECQELSSFPRNTSEIVTSF
ncbi:protocadherin-8 [Pantherophis guttatus]|uniref:Protocadherin-8 n=1 Tax=Pantherophis guttatus TaxID=94885 RepID=A0ABM3Z2A6_PANGU|nr:protocadherin-8 [Pantherophis guttatus]